MGATLETFHLWFSKPHFLFVFKFTVYTYSSSTQWHVSAKVQQFDFFWNFNDFKSMMACYLLWLWYLFNSMFNVIHHWTLGWDTTVVFLPPSKDESWWFFLVVQEACLDGVFSSTSSFDHFIHYLVHLGLCLCVQGPMISSGRHGDSDKGIYSFKFSKISIITIRITYHQIID